MTPRQNKNLLMNLGLTVADVARDLCRTFSHVTEKSMYSMIDDMIWGRNFYPKYAEVLNERYGFKFQRPASHRSTKELLKG